MSRERYLFLCHGGEKRSKTAVSVARELVRARGLDVDLEPGSSDSITPNNQEYMARNLSAYDRIFVMEEDIAKKLQSLGIFPQKIYCLNIPDNYEKGSEELRAILKERLGALI